MDTDNSHQQELAADAAEFVPQDGNDTMSIENEETQQTVQPIDILYPHEVAYEIGIRKSALETMQATETMREEWRIHLDKIIDSATIASFHAPSEREKHQASVTKALMTELKDLNDKVDLGVLGHGVNDTLHNIAGTENLNIRRFQMHFEALDAYPGAFLSTRKDIDTIIIITNNLACLTSVRCGPRVQNWTKGVEEYMEARSSVHLRYEEDTGEYIPVLHSGGNHSYPGKRIEPTADGEATHCMPKLYYLGTVCNKHTSSISMFQTKDLELRLQVSKDCVKAIIAWFTVCRQYPDKMDRMRFLQSSVAFTSNDYEAVSKDSSQWYQGYPSGSSIVWREIMKTFVNPDEFKEYLQGSYKGRADLGASGILSAVDMLATVRFYVCIQEARMALTPPRIIRPDNEPGMDVNQQLEEREMLDALTNIKNYVTACEEKLIDGTLIDHDNDCGRVKIGQDLLEYTYRQLDQPFLRSLDLRQGTLPMSPEISRLETEALTNYIDTIIDTKVMLYSEPIISVFASIGMECSVVMEHPEGVTTGQRERPKYVPYICPSNGAPDGKTGLSLHFMKESVRNAFANFENTVHGLLEFSTAGATAVNNIKLKVKRFVSRLCTYVADGNYSSFGPAGWSMSSNGGLSWEENWEEEWGGQLPSLMRSINYVGTSKPLSPSIKAYHEKHRSADHRSVVMDGQTELMNKLLQIVDRSGAQTPQATITAIGDWIKLVDKTVGDFHKSRNPVESVRLEFTMPFLYKRDTLVDALTPEIFDANGIQAYHLSFRRQFRDAVAETMTRMNALDINKFLRVSQSFALPLIEEKFQRTLLAAVKESASVSIALENGIRAHVVSSLINAVGYIAGTLTTMDARKVFMESLSGAYSDVIMSSRLQGYPTLNVLRLALGTGPYASIQNHNNHSQIVSVISGLSPEMTTALAFARTQQWHGNVPRAHFLAARSAAAMLVGEFLPSHLVQPLATMMASTLLATLIVSDLPMSAKVHLRYYTHGRKHIKSHAEVQHIRIGEGSVNSHLAESPGGTFVDFVQPYSLNSSNAGHENNLTAVMLLRQNLEKLRHLAETAACPGLFLQGSGSITEFVDILVSLVRQRMTQDLSSDQEISYAVFSGILSKLDSIWESSTSDLLLKWLLTFFLIKSRAPCALYPSLQAWKAGQVFLWRFAELSEEERASTLLEITHELHVANEGFKSAYRERMAKLGIAVPSLSVIKDNEARAMVAMEQMGYVVVQQAAHRNYKRKKKYKPPCFN